MILYCYGTRPEFIKIKKIIESSYDIPHKVLYISQHEDLVIGDYDFKINIKPKKNRLDSIVSSILCDNIDDVLNGIDYVLVQGDTASAFSMALSAFHRQIKVIHLESGLRTYDKLNPYPEEIYRQLISRISDIHLCPTENNLKNLINEKVIGDKYVVGNSGLDNIKNKNITYENIVLVTLHRRENHEILDKWFNEINLLANKHKDINFIIPLHPNPNVKKHKNILNNLTITNPLTHVELLEIISKCKLVISDSGGIQEECSFLNKKVIVCRKITERTESIGVHSFLCESPDKLDLIFNDLIYNFKVDSPCPYGDGKSSDKIINIFKTL